MAVAKPDVVSMGQRDLCKVVVAAELLGVQQDGCLGAEPAGGKEDAVGGVPARSQASTEHEGAPPTPHGILLQQPPGREITSRVGCDEERGPDEDILPELIREAWAERDGAAQVLFSGAIGR